MTIPNNIREIMYKASRIHVHAEYEHYIAYIKAIKFLTFCNKDEMLEAMNQLGETRLENFIRNVSKIS